MPNAPLPLARDRATSTFEPRIWIPVAPAFLASIPSRIQESPVRTSPSRAPSRISPRSNTREPRFPSKQRRTARQSITGRAGTETDDLLRSLRRDRCVNRICPARQADPRSDRLRIHRRPDVVSGGHDHVARRRRSARRRGLDVEHERQQRYAEGGPDAGTRSTAASQGLSHRLASMDERVVANEIARCSRSVDHEPRCDRCSWILEAAGRAVAGVDARYAWEPFCGFHGSRPLGVASVNPSIGLIPAGSAASCGRHV